MDPPNTSASDWVWTDLTTRDPGSASDGHVASDPAAFEAVRAEGYAQGVRDGLEQGKVEALQELESSMRALTSALEELRAKRAEWDESLESNLTVLSTAIARILLEEQLDEKPDAFAVRVRAALAAFPQDDTVRIRVHPRDLSSISQVRPDGGGGVAISGSRSVQWIPDEQVGMGGVIIEGPSKIVDGRVEPALARVYRRLTDG